jgi:hypothetical protein
MLKTLIAACALCLVALTSTATAAAAISFADIPWGSDGATVTSLLAERGFKFVQVDQDGDLQFNGTIDGERAGLIALRTKDDKLVKWIITIVPGERRTLDYYRRLKRDLSERYGKAVIDREAWSFPYADGEHVGHEEIAIRAGKGVIHAAWSTERALPAVVIEVTDRLLVTAAYEGPGWNEELGRRRAGIASGAGEAGTQQLGR